MAKTKARDKKKKLRKMKGKPQNAAKAKRPRSKQLGLKNLHQTKERPRTQPCPGPALPHGVDGDSRGLEEMLDQETLDDMNGDDGDEDGLDRLDSDLG